MATGWLKQVRARNLTQ